MGNNLSTAAVEAATVATPARELRAIMSKLPREVKDKMMKALDGGVAKLTPAAAATALGFDGKAASNLLAALGGKVEKPPHFGFQALLASLESGALAALKGSWVAKLESQGRGLEWEEVAGQVDWCGFPEALEDCTYLRNKALAAALSSKTTFTSEEWESFGIETLGKKTFVKSGDRYFRPIGRATGRLSRRQDLPPEAFWTAAELRRLVEALGKNYALLFVALSYRWLTKAHPDPKAFHLEIIAAVARLYMKGKNENGLHSSPLGQAFEEAALGAPDFALFWDFASLFQTPRTPAEDALFLPGLRASNVWYGHEGSICWMQQELPEGFAEQMASIGLAPTYDTSGWCFVEASISAGLKVGKRRLDLSRRRMEREIRIEHGGYFILEDVCAAKRQPPLLPDVVRHLLETEKQFTARADIGVVGQLYRAFFDGATSFTTELNFGGLVWGNEEMKQLVKVLHSFVVLKSLDLRKNALGATGVATLAQALPQSSIASLNLNNNALCGVDKYDGGTYTTEGIVAICDMLKVNSSLTSLSLRYNSIGGYYNDVHEFQADSSGIKKLAEALKSNSSLRELNLSSNDLNVEAAKHLAEGLAKNKALTSLNLSGCELRAEGTAYVAEMLKVNTTLKELNLAGNYLMVEGTMHMAEVLKVNTTLKELNVPGNNLDETAKQMLREAAGERVALEL